MPEGDMETRDPTIGWSYRLKELGSTRYGELGDEVSSLSLLDFNST